MCICMSLTALCEVRIPCTATHGGRHHAISHRASLVFTVCNHRMMCNHKLLFCYKAPSWLPNEADLYFFIARRNCHLCSLCCVQKADIWSCGIILYAMLYGQHPFQAKDSTFAQKVVQGDYTIPKDIAVSGACLGLLQSILVSDPRARMSMADIKQHPWFLQGQHMYRLPPSLIMAMSCFMPMCNVTAALP